MGYLLLGIELLVAGWLAIALLAVLSGRLRSSVARGFLNVGSWVVVLAPFAVATFIGLVIRTWGTRPFWFWPLVTIDVLLFGGAVIVWVLGRRAGRRWQAAKARGEEPAEVDSQVWSLARLGIALAIVLLLASATFRSLDAAVQQQMSDVRTEAETLAVSVMPTPVPERENAAGLYRQLGEHFRYVAWPEVYQNAGEELGVRPLPEIHEPVDFASAELGEFLQQQSGVRELLLEASAREGCNFLRDYTRPSFWILLPEIQWMSQSASLLAIDARYRAATGDFAGALDNIKALYRIADHTASDPFIVATAVAISIDRLAMKTLEYVLSRGNFDAALLAALHIELGTSQYMRLRRARRMEEAMFMAACGDFVNLGQLASIADTMDPSKFGVLYRIFMVPQDLAGLRQYSSDLDGAFDGGMTLEESLKRAREVQMELDSHPPGFVAKALRSDAAIFIALAVRGEAARRLARTGQALYLYRAEHGEFPDDLQKLTPDFLPFVPRDPFDGKPLQLRNTPRGCVVYCAGLEKLEGDRETYLQGVQEEQLEFECTAH